MANTFAAFQESLPKPRPRLKSRAFPTTAFGKLLLKLCGQILRCFFCVYQYFHSGLALQSAAVQKPRIPYHCIPKIASPTFRVHSVCFALFRPTLSRPTHPLQRAHSLPPHSLTHSLPRSLTPSLPDALPRSLTPSSLPPSRPLSPTPPLRASVARIPRSRSITATISPHHDAFRKGYPASSASV